MAAVASHYVQLLDGDETEEAARVENARPHAMLGSADVDAEEATLGAEQQPSIYSHTFSQHGHHIQVLNCEGFLTKSRAKVLLNMSADEVRPAGPWRQLPVSAPTLHSRLPDIVLQLGYPDAVPNYSACGAAGRCNACVTSSA
jgi:hypothetical protein